jgi:spore coat protein H
MLVFRRIEPSFMSNAVWAWGRVPPLAFFIAGLLGLALSGCDQREEPPAVQHQPPAERPPFQMASSNVPPDVKLPIYELKMDPQDLMKLERSPYSNDTCPATFIADGKVYERIKVRHRGQWARSWPKKPLKIFFNQDKLFEGHGSLNLNSGWRDPAFVRETLAYAVYAACGVPASRSRPVRLDVNGQFYGLYMEVEQPDKAFLRQWKLGGASVFKAVSRSNQADERDLGSESAYHNHYKREAGKSDDLSELQSFCHELAGATNTADFFARHVDVEKYINYLAATVLVQNWDCYNKNHFLVCNTRDGGKWFAVPWDLDRTFGDHWNRTFGEARFPAFLGTQQMPGITGWNRLADRFLSDPTLRSRFLDRLAQLLDTEFTTAKLFPILDRLESEIGSGMAIDRQRWPSRTADLHSGIAGIKSYIEYRRAFLQNELVELRRDERGP